MEFFWFLSSHWLVKMGQSPLNVAEWEAVLAKMLRYHDNISKEIGTLVIEIKAGMKSELVPVAEDKANYGKVVHARASRQGGQGPYHFLEHESKCIFNKRTIKVCVSCS